MSESVWDYPRPPRVEPLGHGARVEFDGVIVARSESALRVLETSHPPTIYFPRPDVRLESLTPSRGMTLCEWKGQASYFDITGENRAAASAAWMYTDPLPAYRALKGYIAFYPGRVDACFIGEERATAQAGDYYGGWITADITGPFKGRSTKGTR
jgi:uncharacterized protein (DUF427 family)